MLCQAQGESNLCSLLSISSSPILLIMFLHSCRNWLNWMTICSWSIAPFALTVFFAAAAMMEVYPKCSARRGTIAVAQDCPRIGWAACRGGGGRGEGGGGGVGGGGVGGGGGWGGIFGWCFPSGPEKPLLLYPADCLMFQRTKRNVIQNTPFYFFYFYESKKKTKWELESRTYFRCFFVLFLFLLFSFSRYMTFVFHFLPLSLYFSEFPSARCIEHFILEILQPLTCACSLKGGSVISSPPREKWAWGSMSSKKASHSCRLERDRLPSVFKPMYKLLSSGCAVNETAQCSSRSEEECRWPWDILPWWAVADTEWSRAPPWR